jgi:hypothetical protein
MTPSWRLLGAVGYLGFDIAALGALFGATGDAIPVDALVLGYVIGYIANVLPIPGGFGVLEGGLAGMLIAYGAPPARAAAAVVVYHAIAFWIPSFGGLIAPVAPATNTLITDSLTEDYLHPLDEPAAPPVTPPSLPERGRRRRSADAGVWMARGSADVARSAS